MTPSCRGHCHAGRAPCRTPEQCRTTLNVDVVLIGIAVAIFWAAVGAALWTM
jgi:hypothetical protein